MSKRTFKEKVLALLKDSTDDISWDDKVYLMKQAINELDRDSNYDVSNKGKSWTDDELRIILKAAPTKENALLFAKAFKRGYGSIEQIYRWAAEDQLSVDEKRPDDAFIKQIKRIAKDVGWRAT